MNETEIGQKFITGGESELTEIIHLYGEKLLRYATAIVCNYQDAEDVVQEVFLAAYQTRKNFDGKNLSAWLYKITYNRSINQLKKRKFLLFSEIKEQVSPKEMDNGPSEEMLRALRRLKPKERAVIYGRIMDEISYEELSQRMGCSPTALRKQYERARKKLAGYLTAEFNQKEYGYEQI